MAYAPNPYQRPPNNKAQVFGALIALVLVLVGINKFIYPIFPVGEEKDEPPPAAAAPAAPPGGCWLLDEPPCDVAYFQGDKPWGQMKYGDGPMAETGCGPTAMAMVITALKRERVTPDVAAKYALSKGQYAYAPDGGGRGSFHTVAPVLAEHWGLRAQKLAPPNEGPINEADIKKAIADGGYVVLSGGERSPFTSAGHYIVIRAVNPDGTVMIANSAGGNLRGTNDRPHKLSDLLYLNRKRKTSAYAIFR